MREISLIQSEFADLSEEILMKGGSFKFKVHGYSMYPFIRDGDIITVKPIEVSKLKVGDIAYYRSTKNMLVAHRIIRKELQGNIVMFMTRGDFMLYNDGWIRSEQVLGLVLHLQRGQKIIQFNQKFWKWITQLWIKIHPVGPLFIKLAVKVKQAIYL